LKKRTKKLSSVARAREANQAALAQPATSKSFLVLFFKKELLPFLRLTGWLIVTRAR
jgi:hypothetical protein